MNLFHLPDLGEGLAEAEIHEWYVSEGDTVTIDQPLVSMETAKAVVDVPSPENGKILKLYGKKGDIIATHAPLVQFEGKGKDQGTVVGSLQESTTILDESNMIIGSPKKSGGTPKAMPAVRALAKELHVDLGSITPTGHGGMITIDDVKNAAGAHTTLTGNVETLHGVRRSMAMVMTESHKSVVPVTLMDDADVTNISSDFTARLIQAMVFATQTEPALNAWYDGKQMARVLHSEVHVGLAMDTEEGLFVPVLKNAEAQTTEKLRADIDHFKKSVRDRTILPADLQGATITLSNFGTLAGRYASPIIVPPMVAILGCGKCRDEVRVHQGQMAIRRIAPLSLTFDHRAVTGGEASRFLGALIKHLENGS